MKKIAVAVRASAELQDGFELVEGGTQVDADYLEFRLSDWDAAAVDAASQLADSVVAVSVGGPEADDALREALTLGAAHAVRIDPGSGAEDPLVVAKLLSAHIGAADVDAVLCGAQSGDHGGAAVPAALGSYLGWPSAIVANRIEQDVSDPAITVTRELEAGVVEVSTFSLPAVVSVQTGIYEHKYPSFIAKRKASSYAIEVLELADIGLTEAQLDAVRGAERVRFAAVEASSNAEQLTGTAPEVASRILSIVKERLN